MHKNVLLCKWERMKTTPDSLIFTFVLYFVIASFFDLINSIDFSTKTLDLFNIIYVYTDLH